MKLFSAISALLFVGFASLQFNDLDPHIWVTVYLIAAVAMVSRGFFPVPKIVYLTGAAAAVVVGLVIFPWHLTQWVNEELQPGVAMKSDLMEESREGLGLVIVAIFLAVAGLWPKKGAA